MILAPVDLLAFRFLVQQVPVEGGEVLAAGGGISIVEPGSYSIHVFLIRLCHNEVGCHNSCK